jgi:hypothetical protein
LVTLSFLREISFSGINIMQKGVSKKMANPQQLLRVMVNFFEMDDILIAEGSIVD